VGIAANDISSELTTMKEPPLVSQYVERISREAVEKYRTLLETYVKRRHGIYALYKKKRLYYVGLAKDLRWRLRQHLKDHHGHSWDRFSVYLTIGPKHLKELETLILRITGKPPGNKVKGKFVDSENLKRRLKREIKASQRNELLALMDQSIEADDRDLLEIGKRSRKPILAPYVRAPLKLRAKWKGRTFKARVRRDGSIRFRGRTYRSPSAAGGAASKSSVDGWYFWRFERAPGDWIKLNELRK